MNLNDPKHPWARLTAAARTVADNRDTAAPYGFATRVTALAWAPEHKAISLVERFALRAVGIACLLALLSVAANYSVITSRPPAPATAAAGVEDELPVEDPVALLLDA
jgi:hypothetical protein